MRRRDLLQFAQDLVPGEKVKLTLKLGKPDRSVPKPAVPKFVLDDLTRESLTTLVQMRNRTLRFDDMDWALLHEIAKAGYYNNDADRVVTVEILDGFNANAFATRLSEGLELVEKVAA